MPASLAVAIRNAVGGYGPFSVREVHDLFESYGFSTRAQVEDAGGERRTAAQEHLQAIQWSSSDAQQRLFRLVEEVLAHYPETDDPPATVAIRLRAARDNVRATTEAAHTPADVDVDGVWGAGSVRCFISHTSAHRVEVATLADQLTSYNVAAFVAHDAIRPSEQWQDVIRRALGSCHVLLAYVTPDFPASDWCDQEVGWALGRGVPVIPIRVGQDPYGFFGSTQALTPPTVPGAVPLPSLVIDALITASRPAASQPRTPLRQAVVIAVVESFGSAPSFDSVRTRFKLLTRIPPDEIDGTLRATLLAACQSNNQIAHGVINQPLPPRDATDAVREHLGISG